MADSLFPEEELASHLSESTRKYPLKYTDWDLRKLIKQQDKSRNRYKRNKLAAYPGRPTPPSTGRKIAPGNFQSKRLCFQYLTGSLVKKGKPGCCGKRPVGAGSFNPKDCGCLIEITIKTYDYFLDIAWMPMAGWNNTGRINRSKASFEHYLDKFMGPYGDILGPDGSKFFGNDPKDYPWGDQPDWDSAWPGNWDTSELLSWYNWIIKHAEGYSKDPFGILSAGSSEVPGIWTPDSPLLLRRRGQGPCENGNQAAGTISGGEQASEGSFGLQYSKKCDCWVFFSMLRFKIDGAGSGESSASIAEETTTEYVWECPKYPETAHCVETWTLEGPTVMRCDIDDSFETCEFCDYSCLLNLSAAMKWHFHKINQSNPTGKYGNADGECELFRAPPGIKIQDC